MCFRRKTLNVHVYLRFVGHYLDLIPKNESELKELSNPQRKALITKNSISNELLNDIIKLFVPVRGLRCGKIPKDIWGIMDFTQPKEIPDVEIPNIHVLLQYIIRFTKVIPDLLKSNPGPPEGWDKFNKKLSTCRDALNICQLIFSPPKGDVECQKLFIERPPIL